MITETVSRQESWESMTVNYIFEVRNGGVGECRTMVSKGEEGYKMSVERTYWRDMSFAPTKSKNALTEEENAHIAETVNGIFASYPDVKLEIPMSDGNDE